jgi:two-component sensor histidine kinase
MNVVDTGNPDKPLYVGATGDAAFRKHSETGIMGRQWAFDIHGSSPASGAARYVGTALLGILSVLFAGATAYAVAARQDEAARARDLAAAAARESDYRNLLLQEMKHRIKNHIARIQSIARQSARGATDVKAFVDSFDARLQSMAAVQEILAGTATPQAEVRAILRKELQQALDTEAVEHLLEGPPVRLDERRAHAFALVAHELMTNAMKYGGLSPEGSGLKVTWSVRPGEEGAAPDLWMDWDERFVPAGDGSDSGSGFGSRLIEASLKGELSGTLTRDFGPEGLRIALRFPLNPELAALPGGAGTKTRRRA